MLFFLSLTPPGFDTCKKIPPEIIEPFPQVPWKEFAGLRDKMVHGYFSISPVILWETIQNDLTSLAIAVKELLRNY